MPLSVLKLLSHDRFQSGEVLSRILGLSRASVHNLVERAREMGVEVHAVRGRGYRLAEPCSWLDSARLANGGVGFVVEVHGQLVSTNSHVLEIAQRGGPHKHVTVTEIQSAGRGRRGRAWLAQLGGGLTFSLLWRFRRPLTALSGLSLVVGLGLARALHRIGVSAARVKWPNDILVDDAKLAGILIETQGDMLGDAVAVIGIGLNVRAGKALHSRVENRLTSLADLMDDVPDRNDLLLAILKELDAVLIDFDAGGFPPFAEEWQAWHAWQERRVYVQGMGQGVLEGVAAGVDKTGALRVVTSAGERLVHSGEVSLRLGSGA